MAHSTGDSVINNDEPDAQGTPSLFASAITRCATPSTPNPTALPGSLSPEPHAAVFDMPSKKDKWIFIRTFTPSWFTVTMGTGIVSLLLFELPYNGKWLYWISVAIFALNVLLFILFTFISALRYFLYRGLWQAMICHPVVSLFLGTFPISLSLIVEMVVVICVPAWGEGAITLAWVLWWIDVVISVAVCYCMPFVIMHIHETSLPSMVALWVLPIAPAIVASGIGGVVAEVLVDEQHALWTLILSYVLWGTSIPLSLTCLVMYFHRLTMHNLPPREVIVSVFLPIAPLGMGSFAIIQFGVVAAKLFPKTGTLGGIATSPGDILYVIGWIVGLVLWAYGLAWLFFALASISRGKFPFNIGWWGLTFPLGVWTTATISIGEQMPSRFFNVLGTVFSVIVTLLWLMVSAGTIRGIINGQIFVAPDLKLWEENKGSSMAKDREG